MADPTPDPWIEDLPDGTVVFHAPPPVLGPSIYDARPDLVGLADGIVRAELAGRDYTAADVREQINVYAYEMAQFALSFLTDDDGWQAARECVTAVLDAITKDFRVPIIPGARAAITGSLRRTVFERDRYRCRSCGAWVDLQIDHVVPHSKGGPTTEANLQTLCQRCNGRKTDTL